MHADVSIEQGISCNGSVMTDGPQALLALPNVQDVTPSHDEPLSISISPKPVAIV